MVEETAGGEVRPAKEDHAAVGAAQDPARDDPEHVACKTLVVI